MSLLRHRSKGLGLHRLLAFRGLRHSESSLTRLGEACGQFGQITPFTEKLAAAIDDFQVHLQMAFKLLRSFSPGLVADPHAGHAQQLTAQRLRQRAFTKGQALQRGLDEIRDRHKVLAHRLGQVAYQRDALGFQQPRHQPLQTLGRQRQQQGCRNAQGHAVTRVVGLEVVAQRQAQIAQTQRVRVLRCGDFAGLTGQHVFFAHDQQLRVVLAFGLVPAVERGRLVNLRRNPRFVEAVQGVFVSQNIATASLGFQLVELFQQAGIGTQALGPREDFATHQTFADEQLARYLRVDRPVMHGTTTDHDQAEQRDLFKRDDLPALLLPMRLEMILLDQVPGQRLDPVRIDLGHHARIQLGGFHQLGSHQPLRALLAQP